MISHLLNEDEFKALPRQIIRILALLQCDSRVRFIRFHPAPCALDIKGQLTGPEPVPIKTGYSWMDQLAAVQSTSARSSDFPALVKISLEDLARQMEGRLRGSEDPVTQAHLKDCLKEIHLILNPRN